MAYNFSKNDPVIYGKNGLFILEDIQRLAFGTGKKTEYYVLQDVGKSHSTVYVPCNCQQLVDQLRPVFTKQEIDSLLEQAKGQEIEWIEDKNQRASYFHQVTGGEDYIDLILLANCIYQKKQELETVGKKLWVDDISLLSTIEKRIEEEFCFALDLTGPELHSYIQTRLGLCPQS